MTTERTAQPMLPGLRAPGNRVSRRAISYWTARAALGSAVVVLAEVIFAAATGFTTTWRVVLAVTIVVFGAHAVIMPRWRYSVHRWEVTDSALYTRSGW